MTAGRVVLRSSPYEGGNVLPHRNIVDNIHRFRLRFGEMAAGRGLSASTNAQKQPVRSS